jgi:hypothetical protein
LRPSKESSAHNELRFRRQAAGAVAGFPVSADATARTLMSNPPAATPPAKQPPPRRGRVGSLLGYILLGRRRPGEIVVVSHSNLFYWWPVWLVGFIMAGVTYFHDVHAGYVRGHPKVVEFKGVDPKSVTFVDEIKDANREKYVKSDFPAIITDATVDAFPTTHHAGDDVHLWPYMHNSKSLGIIFSITLLLVIVITNVSLRGLWSVVIIIVIVLGSIIFMLAGWWEYILVHGGHLAIHLNMGAYLFLALTLFVIWLINFVFFDRQHYVAVTAGQVRLKLMIGEGEIVYDTTGMVFQKQRSDLFRHMILGMGSGDLIIRPAGGKDAIDLPNVLFVGSKVREIQELIKEKEVVAG